MRYGAGTMEKVFVGLSGGVDSAVSAALLQQAGYDVTGAFIKIWHPEFIECTWREDRLDAMRVCAALSIPFREIDLSKEYWDEVVESMLSDYKRGITPNPDVLCNERIKFGSFKRWAIEQGAKRVATGHYARIEVRNGRPVLLRGVDESKDQSYFLHRLSEDDLGQWAFPIGSLRKSQVRERSRALGLPVAEKPDSQGLCFVGAVSMRDFLKRFITVEAGLVLDVGGTVVGSHAGAALYTVGQRHGFTIDSANATVPYFIVSIDIGSNTLTVSANRSDVLQSAAFLVNMHWIAGTSALPLRALVQSRYRDTPVGALLSIEGEYLKCSFDEPHAASPGQSLVIYDGEVCLGGGIIASQPVATP